MQDEYRFNAFGRLLAVVRKNDRWIVACSAPKASGARQTCTFRPSLPPTNWRNTSATCCTKARPRDTAKSYRSCSPARNHPPGCTAIRRSIRQLNLQSLAVVPYDPPHEPATQIRRFRRYRRRRSDPRGRPVDPPAPLRDRIRRFRHVPDERARATRTARADDDRRPRARRSNEAAVDEGDACQPRGRWSRRTRTASDRRPPDPVPADRGRADARLKRNAAKHKWLGAAIAQLDPEDIATLAAAIPLIRRIGEQ